MTAHINAADDAFADICLLPGDPLRAEFIAEKFLDKVTQVNTVRNMLGFTGLYRGKRISVMGSGMGIPSISIYAKELITEFNVKTLVRVGSCGAVNRDIELRDIIIASGACTDSVVNRTRFEGMDFAAIPDFRLTQSLVESADKIGENVHVGNTFSADLFYTPRPDRFELLEKMGILGVEMEAAGLFGIGAEYAARTAAICTVSDHILKGGELSAEDRQSSFDAMVKIALETAVSLA